MDPWSPRTCIAFSWTKGGNLAIADGIFPGVAQPPKTEIWADLTKSNAKIVIDFKPCLNLIVVLSVWPNFKALVFSANAAMMATLPRKKCQTISVSIKLQLPLWCVCTFCVGVSFRLVSNGMNLFIRASVEHRGLTWFYHPEKGRFSNIYIYIS